MHLRTNVWYGFGEHHSKLIAYNFHRHQCKFTTFASMPTMLSFTRYSQLCLQDIFRIQSLVTISSTTSITCHLVFYLELLPLLLQ